MAQSLFIVTPKLLQQFLCCSLQSTQPTWLIISAWIVASTDTVWGESEFISHQPSVPINSTLAYTICTVFVDELMAPSILKASQLVCKRLIEKCWIISNLYRPRQTICSRFYVRGRRSNRSMTSNLSSLLRTHCRFRHQQGFRSRTSANWYLLNLIYRRFLWRHIDNFDTAFLDFLPSLQHF